METISYYLPNGAITGILKADPKSMELNKQVATDPYIDGEWDCQVYYVTNNQATLRPENPTTVSGQILENVPVPATVIVNGTSYETSESRVELGFSQPGTYAVKVVAWPHLDKEFSVENPA
jgi:hypothetical protein